MATGHQASGNQPDDLNLDVNLDDFSLDDDQLFADLDNEVRLDADQDAGGAASDDLDLGADLDLDLGEDAGGGAGAGSAAAGGADDLDLGGDLDLDLGDEAGGGAGGGSAAADSADDLDLGGDVDLDLGDEAGDEPAGDQPAEAGAADELDLDNLGDVELDLGDEPGAAAAPDDTLDLGADAGGDVDLDLDGELDLGGAGQAGAGSDLELDQDEAAAGEIDLDLGDEGEGAAAGGGDIELDLGDVGGAEPAGGAVVGEELELPDDVELAFEPESGEGGGDVELPGLGDEELDTTGMDFEAVPDVDLDAVDLDEVGLSEAPAAEPAIDLGEPEPSAAGDEGLVDEGELGGMREVEPPDLGMPDPFRSAGTTEPLTAHAMGDEARWGADLHDEFVAAPDVNLSGEQVVELNLDDLERGGGAAAGRAPRRVGEALVLPADEEELEPLDTGAIPSDVVLSIPRKVNVEMGSVTLNGRDLMKLTYGSVVQLSQTVGDPVELVLEGRTIAQGEIVLINGRNLGVRIVSFRK
jgi:flagellar motor switch protein FliN